MHRQHQKALEMIFGIEDDKTLTLSDKITEFVNGAETRALRYFSRFQEFSAHELIALTMGFTKDEAVVPVKVLKPAKMDYKSMRKEQLLEEIAKRNKDRTGSDKISALSNPNADALAQLLIADDQEG